MRVVLDLESNNFLHAGIDYSKLPYRLKPDYKVWCVVCRDVDTQDVYRFVGEFEIKNQLRAFLAEVDEIIGHNIIAFDLPVLKLWAGLYYKVGYFDGMDTVEGHACKITDTLVMSKLLYSDTVQGHSLEDWGKRLGEPKGDFHEFDRYSEEMLTYCIQDTAVNSKMFFKFMEEYNRWPWAKAFRMETKLMDLTVAQEHYGFKFFRDRAIAAVEELTVLMAEKKAIVDPLLPPKTLNKGEQKEYIPPKLQFKKDGTPSANMIKFAAKHGWCLENDHGDYHLWISEDNRPELPLPLEPIVKTGVASVEDNDHVKGYLLSLGWVPNAWKERDLTVNSKKQKRTREEYEESVRRYIEQTLEGGYKEARLEILNCSEDTLAAMLLAKDHMKSTVRVPTSPSVTTQDKELCPGLKLLGEKVAFAKDFAEFMTYRHRKNSIAGGLDEDGEASTGFLTAMREDGRIPTPADTNGANTGRYKHRVVCNIPRATSLYGDKMRALFGVSPNKYQLGFDFASLEARIEGHYVYKYPGGPELAAALLLEKPHDIHTTMAKRLGIARDGAKSVNYAVLYGAGAPKIAKMLGIGLAAAQGIIEAFWEELAPLKALKDKLEEYWKTVGGKKFILGIDGRKIYTRSAHSLVNALFQSGGGLAAKYVAVEIARRNEQAGLLLDPFCHDVEACSGVSQMIVYHDEVQYSVSRDMVRFETFSDEEQAKAAGRSGSSAVGHGKKFYRAYSPMHDTIKASIEHVVKDLKIAVELGFEYQVGLDWYQCH